MDATEKNTADALFVKMVMLAWQNQNNEANKLLDALSDEQLSAQTAPGRNSGIYLLGHLAAINDNLF
ncbi:MAG TPA: DinB family protein, partial [Parafilimonas sp.]|nr:DinB family protein [Parafilimonas sp.]